MATSDGLVYFMRCGYALVLVAVGLMMWASYVGASDPPCTFNPLCTCSNAYADNFGTVQCTNVQFASMPIALNLSKVYALKMDGTGLTEIDAYFLQATGLYKIEISGNPLFKVPDEAFHGLERSLWELILKENGLIEIPTKALRYLHKLRHLDLSGNEISFIERDSFRGLQNALENLILADNSITHIPIDAFHGLPNLNTLDLSSNNLREITPDVFREQMNSLVKVNFADNLLSEIPYVPLAMLRSLRNLDLSSNKIAGFQIENENQPINVKLALDQLHLEHNEIHLIQAGSFQYFMTINQTFLDFNPIHVISDNAFQSARIRELYIRHCMLDFIEPAAFDGLESSLQVLDLSGNNITTLPEKLFSSFDFLGRINVKDNKLPSMFPQSGGFASFQSDLHNLDVSGDKNGPTSFQDIRRLEKLRTLTLGKLMTNQLTPEDFMGFGVTLENLRIHHAGLRNIRAHAFMHVRGIRRLDLSENSIETIEKDAFVEIGHSLVSLKIAHGLSPQMTQLPDIRELTSLTHLDFSNNRIKSISDTAFHFLKNLQKLELNDNQIEQLAKGTFQRDIHQKLEEISVEFNNLRHISTHSFVDLEKLHTVRLRDNKIERLERRAFMNLQKLTHLSLRGNKLSSISDEAFQNLPALAFLDVSYNLMKTFDFDYFDQVGMLTHLVVNASHNSISDLNDNTTTSFINLRDQDPCNSFISGSSLYHSSIKVLDLSHNNISRISLGFFRPAEVSLISLSLAYNSIMNTSRDTFGNFVRLQILDLSNNYIDYILPDTFRNSRKIQVLNLSQNELTDVAPETFRNLGDLRIVDLSNNLLRTLPDSLFVGDDLEILDLSHNQLIKIPVSSLTNLAALTLCELDLSHNHIGFLNNGTVTITLSSQRLSRLDLSSNRLVRLEDAAFSTLPNLAVLDLSDNNELEVYGRMFIGLERLMELSLDNISLIQAPDLNLPNLRILSIAHNELPSIPPELAANLTSLRVLDLSGNDLTAVPLITHSLPNIRSLSLAGNPISSLTNTSLLGAADTVEYLDIAHLQLTMIENGILNKFQCLRSLRLSTYPGLNNFNIPSVLEDVDNVRELWIEAPAPKLVKVVSKDGVENKQLVQEPASDLRTELMGDLPRKLKTLTISGAGFNRLAEGIFDGVQASSLQLTLHNTTLSGLPSNMFERLGNVYNISITIDSNNKKFNSIPNPNSASYPNHADRVLLTQLNIHYTSLSCDCEIGWVEFWQRKKRQYFCTEQWVDDMSVKSQIEVPSDCEELYQDDDLRSARCSNKNGEPLLEILKSELECGWSAAGRQEVNYLVLIVFAISFVSFLI